jgi:hypothetical protein
MTPESAIQDDAPFDPDEFHQILLKIAMTAGNA